VILAFQTYPQKAQSAKWLIHMGVLMSLIPDDGGELEGMRRRKSEATAKGGQAFLRLLSLAETGDSGQAHTVARFIASTYNGQEFPYDLYDLRLVDVAIGDDMLTCLDALRWAQADLHTLVPDGDQRVRAVLTRWSIEWPDHS
jgi:hypothetical protein